MAAKKDKDASAEKSAGKQTKKAKSPAPSHPPARATRTPRGSASPRTRAPCAASQRPRPGAASVGFLLGGYLSLPTHSALEAALRALVAGVVCYVVVWAAAVFLWRRLVVAELRHAEHELLTAQLAKLQSSVPSASPAVERRGAPVAR